MDVQGGEERLGWVARDERKGHGMDLLIVARLQLEDGKTIIAVLRPCIPDLRIDAEPWVQPREVSDRGNKGGLKSTDAMHNQPGSGAPGLVDLENGDYHLKADSPLRGKGVNLSELYKTDFDGRPLPKTGNWDIGAIQYSATKPTRPFAGKLPEPKEAMRTWTSRTGKKVKGTVVPGSLKDGFVSLKSESGKVIRVRLSYLSDADRAFLDR